MFTLEINFITILIDGRELPFSIELVSNGIPTKIDENRIKDFINIYTSYICDKITSVMLFDVDVWNV